MKWSDWFVLFLIGILSAFDSWWWAITIPLFIALCYCERYINKDEIK